MEKSAIKVDSNGKGIEIGTIAILSKFDIAKGQNCWKAIITAGIKTLENWRGVGHLLNLKKKAHAEVAGKEISNIEFGKWLDATFKPSLPKDQMAYAMRLDNQFDEISAWQKANAPELNTPKALVMRFLAAQKTENTEKSENTEKTEKSVKKAEALAVKAIYKRLIADMDRLLKDKAYLVLDESEQKMISSKAGAVVKALS